MCALVTVVQTCALPIYLKFTVHTPPGEQAHAGLGRVGKPQLDRHAKLFRAAAKATGVDDAWLRAIAHAESGFDAKAVSSKGAQGVMQLMPGVARSEEHTSELQSLMRSSYAAFSLKKK